MTFIVFFFTRHTKCLQIWCHIHLENHPTMSGSSHAFQTPKDMKKHAVAIKGLDPDNPPNNAAFKLVTILVFLLCHKYTTFPPLIFGNSVTRILPPPLYCSIINYSHPPPLPLQVSVYQVLVIKVVESIRLSNGNGNSNGNSYGAEDSDCDGNGNIYGNSNSDGYVDSNGNRDGDCDGTNNSNTDSDIDGYGNG